MKRREDPLFTMPAPLTGLGLEGRSFQPLLWITIPRTESEEVHARASPGQSRLAHHFCSASAPPARVKGVGNPMSQKFPINFRKRALLGNFKKIRKRALFMGDHGRSTLDHVVAKKSRGYYTALVYYRHPPSGASFTYEIKLRFPGRPVCRSKKARRRLTFVSFTFSSACSLRSLYSCRVPHPSVLVSSYIKARPLTAFAPSSFFRAYSRHTDAAMIRLCVDRRTHALTGWGALLVIAIAVAALDVAADAAALSSLSALVGAALGFEHAHEDVCVGCDVWLLTPRTHARPPPPLRNDGHPPLAGESSIVVQRSFYGAVVSPPLLAQRARAADRSHRRSCAPVHAESAQRPEPSRAPLLRLRHRPIHACRWHPRGRGRQWGLSPPPGPALIRCRAAVRLRPTSDQHAPLPTGGHGHQ